jgi:hypothetical protein
MHSCDEDVPQQQLAPSGVHSSNFSRCIYATCVYRTVRKASQFSAYDDRSRTAAETLRAHSYVGGAGKHCDLRRPRIKTRSHISLLPSAAYTNFGQIRLCTQLQRTYRPYAVNTFDISSRCHMAVIVHDINAIIFIIPLVVLRSPTKRPLFGHLCASRRTLFTNVSGVRACVRVMKPTYDRRVTHLS